jgi:hypothetical protein
MEPETYDGADRAVCRPDLLVDDPARAVAQLIVDDEQVAPIGLAAAVEDYDLATSRVLWVRACHPDPVHAQTEAVAWHEQQRRTAYAAMLALLPPSSATKFAC